VAGEGLEGDTVESGGGILGFIGFAAGELPDHDSSISRTGEEDAIFVFFGASGNGGDPIVVTNKVTNMSESGVAIVSSVVFVHFD